MPQLADHPTVRMMQLEPTRATQARTAILDADWLHRLCIDSGADDVGFVEIGRADLDADRDDIETAFPAAKSIIGFVVKMNREPIRTPARSISNLEFHHTGERVNEIARNIARTLEQKGVRALNPAMGFPMETDRFPGKIWTISHKKVAEAAGLGVMGIHRNVIHPKFGNFILLGSILIDAEISSYDHPLDYNPCLECKLCVSACPVGAIKPDGHFDFSACYTHNYREFMGGFTDWVETVADSCDAKAYRQKVDDGESASMWQSLSFGANYKAAYCLAVCPAGEDVISPFLDDKAQFVQDMVKPLQRKHERVYVIPGSDAEQHVAKRFPTKEARPVGNSLRPRSIEGFLSGMPLTFQRGRSKGLDATYHFTFTGDEPAEVTIIISNQKLEIEGGHVGDPDLAIEADSRTWLQFLAKNQGIVSALLTRRVKLKGSPKLLLAFGKCFPS
jgi:Fe-S-cluster-containing hydrogenase component 2